ncbi:hypothetical protein E2C01_078214 [Portunus trituberculatus]|uniref:Uncharacterized protein n=1 Tax=Portunus trituberculatus TaxID=210409 RepID=A0A5B7II51_PORTR|nr:hypothetical protein [Portunus trituberculatus]
MISPAFLIEFADLQIVETVDGVKMVASNASSFLASLVSVNNIQLHFEIRNKCQRFLVKTASNHDDLRPQQPSVYHDDPHTKF